MARARWSTALLCTLVLSVVLASCNPSTSNESSSAPSEEASAPSASASAPFGGRVELELVSEDGEGIQAYVVTDGTPADDVARDCVDHLLETHESAHCYVFRSLGAFEAAGAPSEFGRAMENNCWDAYRSAKGASSGGADTNPEFDPDVCS